MSQSYKIVNYGKKSVRRNYSKIRSDVDMPDLVEIQTGSFDYFVSEGLKEVLRDNDLHKSIGKKLYIFDPLMQSLSMFMDRKERVIANKVNICERISHLIKDKKLFNGKYSHKKIVLERIAVITKIINECTENVY